MCVLAGGGLLAVAAPALAVTFQPANGSPIVLTSGAPGGQEDGGLVAGRFTGSGDLDLAASWVGNGPDGAGSYVSVLLGDGAGGFTPASGSPILITGGATTAGALAVGNFNGDHELDLAVISSQGSGNTPGSIRILLGNGDGTFSVGAPIMVGVDPTSIAVGDFNGDQSDDLAVTNAGSGSVSILLGDGRGGFNPSNASPVTSAGWCPQALTTGYFNGSGHLDLAVADDGCEDAGNLYVLLGDGNGDFTPTASSPMYVGGEPRSVVSGDFTSNGHTDLAVAPGSGAAVDVLLGDGSGNFSTAAGSTTGDYSPTALAIGNFNGDGHLDLAAAGQTNDPHYPTNGVAQVLVGDGSGAFAPLPDSPFTVGAEPETTPTAVVAGDFNQDGREDVAVLSAGCQCTPPNSSSGWGPTVSVLLGEPGNTSAPTPALSGSPNPALTGSPVTLDASASYGGSPNDPVVDYQWDLGSGSFTVDTGEHAMDIATFSQPGPTQVRVKVTNATGAIAVISLTVDVRPAPPPGDTGFSVDGGRYATDNPGVSLSVVWPAYATQAVISNDSAFDAAGDTETVPVAPTVSWTLPVGQSGPANVYLRFPKSSDPQTLDESIVLDMTVPKIQSARRVRRRGASDAAESGARRRAFRVRIHATEDVSGISAAELSNSSTGQGAAATITFRSPRQRGITTLSRVISVTMKRAPMFVRVRSAAGTWSGWRRLA